MAEEHDPSSKTEETTSHRLEEARKRGEVAKTADLPSWATLAGVAGVLAVSGGWLARDLATRLLPFIAAPEAFNLEGGGAVVAARQAMLAATPVLVVILGVAMFCGVAANVVQTGFLWSPEKLKPDFSKLSFQQGLKRMFGLDGLVQFAKSLFKILIVGLVCWFVLRPKADQLQAMIGLDPASILPASAALSALSDRFLLIGASIAVATLAALMVWDALALEPRDAAVLGSLPLGTTTIALAKLASVLLFASVLTLSWNAVPSAVYPALLTINVRGIGGLTLIRLIAGHFVTAALAGLLGFIAVLAVRGLLCVALGEARFQRWSSTIQSALLTMVITALLIAPTVHPADVRAWLSGAAAPPPAAPALWYVGQNETLAGHLLAETPIVPPPRSRITPAQRDANRRDRSAYRELLPRFAVFARRGRQSLLLVGLLALGTFAWTNRRLPERAGAPATSVFAAMLRLCERERSDPDTQAGFFFTIQTLSRSAPHRTILAAAVAVGLTHALLVLAPTDRTTVDPMWPDTGLLALSSVLLGSLAIAVRYAVTVPASGAASWSVRLAWHGDDRRYLSGVKRAATALRLWSRLRTAGA